MDIPTIKRSILVSMLMATVLSTADTAPVTYGLKNTNITLTWQLDTSECTEKSHQFEIFKQITNIIDDEIVEPFPCKNFTNGFYNKNGIYTNSINGYNVYILAKSVNELDLVFVDAQEDLAGTYDLQIFAILDKVPRTLNIVKTADLKVDSILDGREYKPSDKVSINRKVDPDESSILEIKPSAGAPDHVQIILEGSPSGKIESSHNCTRTSRCSINLKPIAKDDDQLLVKAWFSQVQGAEPTTVMSVEITGLKESEIIIISVLVPVVVGALCILLFWVCKKRCNQKDIEKGSSGHPISSYQSDKPPQELTGEHFDVALIYNVDSPSDVKMAKEIKKLLEEEIKIGESKRSPAVYMEGDLKIESKGEEAGAALKRSTYMFPLITKDFVGDNWLITQKDETLMASLEDPAKRWCLVPLHTMNKKDRDFEYPYGLRSLRGLDIFKLFPNQDQKADKEDQDDEIDKITRLLNERHDYKLDRENNQKKLLEEWKEKHATKNASTSDHMGENGDKAATMGQNEVNEMTEMKKNEVEPASGDEKKPLLREDNDTSAYKDVRQPSQDIAHPSDGVSGQSAMYSLSGQDIPIDPHATQVMPPRASPSPEAEVHTPDVVRSQLDVDATASALDVRITPTNSI